MAQGGYEESEAKLAWLLGSAIVLVFLAALAFVIRGFVSESGFRGGIRVDRLYETIDYVPIVGAPDAEEWFEATVKDVETGKVLKTRLKGDPPPKFFTVESPFPGEKYCVQSSRPLKPAA